MDYIKVAKIEGENVTVEILSIWSRDMQLLGYRNNDLTTLILATKGQGRFISTDFIQNEW